VAFRPILTDGLALSRLLEIATMGMREVFSPVYHNVVYLVKGCFKWQWKPLLIPILFIWFPMLLKYLGLTNYSLIILKFTNFTISIIRRFPWNNSYFLAILKIVWI
jgi:hypothetical protein